MSIKPSLLFCFLYFISSYAIAQKNYQPDQVYSVAQLQEDFQILQASFVDVHPGWARYHPADSMRAWFEASRKKIDHPMTELEFRKILYPLIARIGCGHTRIKVPDGFLKRAKKQRKEEVVHHYLPFRAHTIGGRLFIVQNYLQDSTLLPPGTQIHGIDNKPIEQIISDLQSMYPSDGYNTTHKERVLNFDFTRRYRFYYGEKESYDLVVSFGEGEIYKLNLPARSLSRKEYTKEKSTRNKKHRPKDKMIYRKKGYQLRLMEKQENTAILQIDGFAGGRGKRFYKKAFHYLEEQKIKNLVIDLRDNGGGSGKEALTLVSYINKEKVKLFGKKKRIKLPIRKHLESKFGQRVLFPIFIPLSYQNHKDENFLYMGFEKKPKKTQFEGKVYTLYNGFSFSSSVIVGTYLKTQGNLIAIGQETGGGEVGTNAFQMPRLKLPHSKVEMVYPLFRVTCETPIEDQGRGIRPDYSTEYTLEDILNYRDIEMEKVRELVSGSQK